MIRNWTVDFFRKVFSCKSKVKSSPCRAEHRQGTSTTKVAIRSKVAKNSASSLVIFWDKQQRRSQACFVCFFSQVWWVSWRDWFKIINQILCTFFDGSLRISWRIFGKGVAGHVANNLVDKSAKILRNKKRVESLSNPRSDDTVDTVLRPHTSSESAICWRVQKMLNKGRATTSKKNKGQWSKIY